MRARLARQNLPQFIHSRCSPSARSSQTDRSDSRTEDAPSPLPSDSDTAERGFDVCSSVCATAAMRPLPAMRDTAVMLVAGTGSATPVFLAGTAIGRVSWQQSRFEPPGRIAGDFCDDVAEHFKHRLTPVTRICAQIAALTRSTNVSTVMLSPCTSGQRVTLSYTRGSRSAVSPGRSSCSFMRFVAVYRSLWRELVLR